MTGSKIIIPLKVDNGMKDRLNVFATLLPTAGFIVYNPTKNVIDAELKFRIIR
jgi:hypothetical protein